MSHFDAASTNNIQGLPVSPNEAVSLDADDLQSRLDSGAKGLTTEEAARRLRRFGANELPPPRPPSPIRLLAAQATHTLALLLWAAAGLAFLAQLPQLGWAILAIIVLNAGFSFWQEYRAVQVVASLRRRMPLASRVLRDGVEHRVKVRELVAGDVIVLHRGDRVPADARVLRDSGLRLDYSILTGESEPVVRTAGTVSGDAPLADAGNCVLAGTTVMEGSGDALVFATGGVTAFGQVAALTQQLRIEASPLQKELATTARTIAAVAVIVGVICVGAGSLTERLSQKDAFIFGLGILVALIPEGLLPTVSLALAMGVQRMAGRNAVVKRLSCVETLGSTGVICTDKTGTITSSEMTVREVWAAGQRYVVTGRGTSLRGTLKFRESDANRDPEALAGLLRCAVLCNNGIPPHPHRHRAGLGDPLDEALLVVAIKGGMDPDAERGKWPRVKEFSFDASRRRMSTLHRNAGARVLFVKGGPAEVLACCSLELRNGEAVVLDDNRRDGILEETNAVSATGRRPLAMAYRELGEERQPETAEEAERSLVFLGLVIIDNPLRPEVPGAVARCKTAGIRVVMLTGDHAHTALAVARDAGIDDGGAVVTGRDVEEMDDAALREMLERSDPAVFARVTPQQKLRLVEAYRSMGKVVAVTGDGVNDAPALRAADIGVAMGRRGTDVARDAADMVLMDDNFATIVSAIEEGRAVYANIRKFLAYFLTSNVAEAAPFVLFVLAGVPLPLTVLQVLLVDLGTDILPGLALGIDPPEQGVMTKRPREAGERMVNAGLLLRALGFLGIVAAVLSLAGYFIVQWDMAGTPLGDFADDGELYRQATTVTLAGIVACQVGNAFACRSERDSVLSLGLTANPMLLWAIGGEVALLAALIGIPPLADVFDLEPIDPVYWPMLVMFPFLFVAAEEVRKLVARVVRSRA